MVQEAEQFRAEDEAQRDKVTAKNSLESLAFNMKSTVEDEKLQDKISPEDKKTIVDKCNEVISWLDRNQVRIRLLNLSLGKGQRFLFASHFESRAVTYWCAHILSTMWSNSPTSLSKLLLCSFCYPDGREGWVRSPAEGTRESVQPHHLQTIPGGNARRDAWRDARRNAWWLPWWSWRRLLLWPNYWGGWLNTLLTVSLSEIPTYAYCLKAIYLARIHIQ